MASTTVTAAPDRVSSPPARPGTEQPSLSCPLLQIPFDVMLLVTDLLPLPNQMVLAQTCRPLWAILHGRLPLDLRRAATGMGLGRDRHLEYLVCLARSNPGLWLCDSCRRLRRVTDDVLACGHGPCHVRPPRFVSCPDLHMRYHHVQLALKASRMSGEDPACWRQARRLLAPHRSSQWWANPRDDLATQFAAWPRIVAGNFLLLSVYDYSQRRPDAPVTRETMDALAACAHLAAPGVPADQPVKLLDPALAAAVDAAMAEPDGREVCGSCSRCATDFSVQVTPRRLRLRTWRSLGPEGSPQNPEWRAQLDYMTKRRNRAPGRVRELYEGGG